MIYYPLPKGPRYNNPKRIVIHGMGEYIKYRKKEIHATEFLNIYGLSAHCAITPMGQYIKFRDDTQGAWHALKFNSDSLGIEFLVPGPHNLITLKEMMDTPNWVSEAQYKQGREVIMYWIKTWGIKKVDMHHILDPKRKDDPGLGFPYKQLMGDLGL